LEHGNIGDDAFLDACHPNHLGHERIAQALLGCIEAQGLLPVACTAVHALRVRP
jgi:lysophospholipase L1-like esterase